MAIQEILNFKMQYFHASLFVNIINFITHIIISNLKIFFSCFSDKIQCFSTIYLHIIQFFLSPLIASIISDARCKLMKNL